MWDTQPLLRYIYFVVWRLLFQRTPGWAQSTDPGVDLLVRLAVHPGVGRLSPTTGGPSDECVDRLSTRPLDFLARARRVRPLEPTGRPQDPPSAKNRAQRRKTRPRALSRRSAAQEAERAKPVQMAQGNVHVRSLPAALRARTRCSARVCALAPRQKNMMQVLLGAGAMAEEDLLSKLQECIELHQDAARRAKLKFVDNKEQDKATLDSVISVLNTQLDPLGLKVRHGHEPTP